MAEPITDAHVLRVLWPVVRSTHPVLAALRESDPFGLAERAERDEPLGDIAPADEPSLADRIRDWARTREIPGSPVWDAMTVHQRTDWWVHRVGRFTALLAAVPGVGGALADRLPVQDALGAAGQALLLCAIAGEHGIESDAERVRMLADVLFGRRMDPAKVEEAGQAENAAAPKVNLTKELETSEHEHGRPTLRAVASTVWRIGRILWKLGAELGKRPQGRLHHKLMGKLPVVGVLGDYLGERHALRKAAEGGLRWIGKQPRPAVS